METKNIEVTKRSVFRLSWTSNPSNLGYGKPDSTWIERKYRVVVTGTIKTLRKKWRAEKQKCGLASGTYYAYYILGPDGREYNFADIDRLLYDLYGEI